MTRSAILRIALAGALVAAVAASLGYRDTLDSATLENAVRDAGALGPLFHIGLYIVATVLFLPGSVLTLAGGALFGPAWGTLYSLIGATLGATAAFLVARYVASGWVGRKAGGRTKQLIDGVEKEGWRFIAFVRLVPLFPFNLLNYALGLTRIGLVAYVAGSFVFMLPGALAYTYLGYAGREALAGSEGIIQKSLLALALLAAVAFLPRFVMRLRATDGGTLSSADLKQRLDRRDDIAVLDVRSSRDYNGELGHVSGAINIPLDELARRLGEIETRRDRPLAVICRTNHMSGKAVELLRAAGFREALLVSDGMVGWQATGNSVEPSNAAH